MTTFLKIKTASFIGIIIIGTFLTSVIIASVHPKENSEFEKSLNVQQEYSAFRARVTKLIDIKNSSNEGLAISKRRQELIKLFREVSIGNADLYYSDLTVEAPKRFWVNYFNRKLSSQLRNDLLNIFRHKLGIMIVDNYSYELDEHTLFRVRVAKLLDMKISENEGLAISKRRKSLIELFNKASIKTVNMFYNDLTDEDPRYFWGKNFNRRLSSQLRNNLTNIFRKKLGIKTVVFQKQNTFSSKNKKKKETVSCYIDSNNDPDSHYYETVDSISKVLKKPISGSNKRAIAARRTLLNCLFEQFPSQYADYFRAELGDSIMENEISKVFHTRLSGTVARQLLSKLGNSLAPQSSDANRDQGTAIIDNSYEHLRELIWNNLLLDDKVGSEGIAKSIAERPERLARVFNRMPKDSAWAFHTELGLEDNGGEFSKLFHSRLSYELRDQLLRILWERSAPTQEQQSSDANRDQGTAIVDNSYEQIRGLIWNDLLEAIGKQDVAAMVERSERLVREFNRVPKEFAWEFYNELGVKNNGGEFSTLFHEKLSYVLKEKLLGILWERSKQ